jgi:hypothetical protein
MALLGGATLGWVAAGHQRSVAAQWERKDQAAQTLARHLISDLGVARRTIVSQDGYTTRLAGQIRALRDDVAGLQRQLGANRLQAAGRAGLVVRTASSGPVYSHLVAVASAAAAKFQICLSSTNRIWAEIARSAAEGTAHSVGVAQGLVKTVTSACQQAAAADALLQAALSPAGS